MDGYRDDGEKMWVSTWVKGGAVLPFRPYLQGTVLQTAIGAAYIRARLHVVSAYPVIDRSPRLAVASSRRFFLFHTFGRRFNTIYVFQISCRSSIGVDVKISLTRKNVLPAP